MKLKRALSDKILKNTRNRSDSKFSDDVISQLNIMEEFEDFDEVDDLDQHNEIADKNNFNSFHIPNISKVK